MRQGGQPLEAYQAAAFAQPVAGALGKVFAACHASYSSYRQTSTSKCAPVVGPSPWVKSGLLSVDFIGQISHLSSSAILGAGYWAQGCCRAYCIP